MIHKYVDDAPVRAELQTLVQREGAPPVKAILSEIESKGRPIEPADAELIKNVAFFYT